MNIKKGETPKLEKIQLEMNNSFFKSSPANLKRQAIETLQERRRIKYKGKRNQNQPEAQNKLNSQTSQQKERENFNHKLKQYQETDLNSYDINTQSENAESKNELFESDQAKFQVAHNHEKKKTIDMNAYPNMKRYIRQQASDIVRIRNASPAFSSQSQNQQPQSRLKVILEEHSLHNKPTNVMEEQITNNEGKFFPAINSPMNKEQSQGTYKNSQIPTKRNSIKHTPKNQNIRSISVQNEPKSYKIDNSSQIEVSVIQEDASNNFLEELSKEYYINDQNKQDIPSIDEYLRDKTRENFFKKTSKNKSVKCVYFLSRLS